MHTVMGGGGGVCGNGPLGCGCISLEATFDQKGPSLAKNCHVIAHFRATQAGPLIRERSERERRQCRDTECRGSRL